MPNHPFGPEVLGQPIRVAQPPTNRNWTLRTVLSRSDGDTLLIPINLMAVPDEAIDTEEGMDTAKDRLDAEILARLTREGYRPLHGNRAVGNFRMRPNFLVAHVNCDVPPELEPYVLDSPRVIPFVVCAEA
jgi:hypothetical protein